MARTADRNVNHALMARFAEVQGQYERMRDGLADLQRQLARMQITVTSTDELVTATYPIEGFDTALAELHDGKLARGVLTLA